MSYIFWDSLYISQKKIVGIKDEKEQIYYRLNKMKAKKKLGNRTRIGNKEWET